MTPVNQELLIEAIATLARNVRLVAHGDTGPFFDGDTGSGPTGLELLSMAIEGASGLPGSNSLVSAIRDHADAMREVAAAIRGVRTI